jgi:hypothetical protein
LEREAKIEPAFLLPGPEISPRHLYEHRFVEREVCHKFLEACILALKLFEALGLVELQAATLRAPPVTALLRAADLFAGDEYEVTLPCGSQREKTPACPQDSSVGGQAKSRIATPKNLSACQTFLSAPPECTSLSDYCQWGFSGELR